MSATEDFFGVDSVVIPDLPAPIVAYRAWTWEPRSERLVGFGRAKWKRTKATVAEHHTYRQPLYAFSIDGGETAPCVECPSASGQNHTGYGCGIYGFDSVEQLAAHAQSGLNVVWGVVELGGTVFEHAHGYRASHGQVTALYKVPNSPAARAAAKRYAVDLIDFPIGQADMDAARAKAAAAQRAQTFTAPRTNWLSAAWTSTFLTGPSTASTLGLWTPPATGDTDDVESDDADG